MKENKTVIVEFFPGQAKFFKKHSKLLSISFVIFFVTVFGFTLYIGLQFFSMWQNFSQ